MVEMGNVNTLLTSKGRSTSQKQKQKQRETELVYIMDQMDINDIYKAFHLMATKYAFFSSTRRT